MCRTSYCFLLIFRLSLAEKIGQFLFLFLGDNNDHYDYSDNNDHDDNPNDRRNAVAFSLGIIGLIVVFSP